jgi:hypothetical protein
MAERFPEICTPRKTEPDDKKAAVKALWDKINIKFATNENVCKLAGELEKLQYNQTLHASHVANAAAAMVIKEIRDDIENMKSDIFKFVEESNKFNIEICTIADKYNRPALKSPSFHTIYLVPSEKPERDNNWDEWIAIPRRVGNIDSFKWEHLGAKTLDLSWIHDKFDEVNDSIVDILRKINKLSKITSNALLERAIKPLDELKAYINSEEFTQYIFEQLPRASYGTDGLMTAGSFGMLQGLALWAGNDNKALGGGGLNADYVVSLLEKNGFDCSGIDTI